MFPWYKKSYLIIFEKHGGVTFESCTEIFTRTSPQSKTSKVTNTDFGKVLQLQMQLIPLKSANTGKEQYLLLLPMPCFLICYRFIANPVKAFLYLHIGTSKVIMSHGPYWFF